MMKPGEYFLESAPIAANVGRKTVKLVVRQTGDRPVQVGSHYHFYEVNNALASSSAASRLPAKAAANEALPLGSTARPSSLPYCSAIT